MAEDITDDSGSPVPSPGGSLYGGYTYGILLSRWLRQALAHCQLGPNFSTLGRTAENSNQMVADFCNELTDYMLDCNPAISITTQTINYTAGSPDVSVPATLRGLDLVKVQFPNNQSSPIYDLEQINLLNRGMQDSLGNLIEAGFYQEQYPQLGAGFSEDKATLKLFEWPNQDGSVIVTYRAQLTPVTATMVTNALLASPTDTTINLPTICLRGLALGLAWKSAQVAKPALEANLLLKYDNPMYGSTGVPLFKGEMQTLQERFSNIVGIMNDIPQLYGPTHWLDYQSTVHQGFDATMGPETWAN